MPKRTNQKPGSKHWRKKADIAWGKLIRERDGKCALCGTDQRLEAHHLIRKAHVFFRHNLENGVALCSGCHRLSDNCAAHKEPHIIERWVKENRPEQYAWWDKNRWAIIKGATVNYQQVYEHLCEMGETT